MDSATYERTKHDFIKICRAMKPSGVNSAGAAQFGEEFDELCADERLRYVGVKDGLVFLATHPLIIRVPDGTAYGPAAYIARINPVSKTIVCENIDGIRRDECRSAHHPHVNADGLMCLSANASQINLYFADGRLGKIGMHILDFLELARGGNDYLSPTAWPLMKEEDIEQCLRQRRAGTK